MKKLFVMLAVAAMFAACGTKAAESTESVDSTAVDTVEVVDTVAVDTVVAD